MDFIVFMEKEILNKKRQGKIKTAKNYQGCPKHSGAVSGRKKKHDRS